MKENQQHAIWLDYTLPLFLSDLYNSNIFMMYSIKKFLQFTSLSSLESLSNEYSVFDTKQTTMSDLNQIYLQFL